MINYSSHYKQEQTSSLKMTISNVFIHAYKSILELTTPIDPQVSVLIGPNESGKTNFLKAMASFNPESTFDYSQTCQYSDFYKQKKMS